MIVKLCWRSSAIQPYFNEAPRPVHIGEARINTGSFAFQHRFLTGISTLVLKNQGNAHTPENRNSARLSQAALHTVQIGEHRMNTAPYAICRRFHTGISTYVLKRILR
jgi:hypothetical protein